MPTAKMFLSVKYPPVMYDKKSGVYLRYLSSLIARIATITYRHNKKIKWTNM